MLFEDDIFKTEIPLFSDSNSKIPINTDKIPINTDKRKEKIIDYIIGNGSISNKEACELLGLSSSTVKKIFEKMVADKILLPVNERKNRRYLLVTD